MIRENSYITESVIFYNQFYNPYYQESVLPETTEQYNVSVDQHQATDYFEANTVKQQIQDKQESYDNFFRKFLQK